VAVSAALLLLVAAPLMRGGNRQVALIGLEAIALFFLLSVWVRAAMGYGQLRLAGSESWINKLLLAILLLSPAWLALVYLVPVSSTFWYGLPGRSVYEQLLMGAGIPPSASMPLSLVPDATKASLLAGIPLVAGFIAGYASRLSQLKLILSVVAGMAFLQVLFGLLQAAGGGQSSLYFAVEFAGRPLGTFANTNHFADYVGMALTGYIWLAWRALDRPHRGVWSDARFGERHAQAFWVAGGLFLVSGVLMTTSRGAALSVLPAAMLAGGVALLVGREGQSWRRAFLVLAAILVAAAALVGVGGLLSRFALRGLEADASFRGMLAASTLHGASEFWPWGAGWGSYASVYPHFQPVAVNGYADYAHQDYAQMLFEGGIFAVVLAAAFAWLAINRALRLIRTAIGPRMLQPDEVACAISGLGLLGFLLHSLVEFNMHIPANAILAALLAGAYLRPLRPATGAHDRPA
jgi:hypothetical protein